MFPSLDRAMVNKAPQLIWMIYSSFDKINFFSVGYSYIFTCRSNSIINQQVLCSASMIGEIGVFETDGFRVLGFFIPEGIKPTTSFG